MDLSTILQGITQQNQGQQGFQQYEMMEQQQSPMQAELLQKKIQLNQDGYINGIPSKIFDLLEPDTKTRVQDDSNIDRLYLIHEGIMGNKNFMEAVNAGDLPKAKLWVDKYLDLYKIRNTDNKIKKNMSEAFR